MKSLSTLAGALLLMASGASFAAVQTTAHPAAPAPAAAPAATHSATPAATAHAGTPAPAKTDLKAEKKQIREHEKTDLAACKSMKGAEKSACKKEAHHKASVAMADLKTRKHG